MITPLITYSQCDGSGGSNKGNAGTPGNGSSGQGPGSGIPNSDSPPIATANTDFRGSLDPNEMNGPVGFGENRFIAKKDPIPYSILFENDPLLATAPANFVRVITPISQLANLSSFRLGSFGFNELIFNVPANSTSYSQRLSVVVDSVPLFVDVIAGIDVTTREAFWIFQTIDPQTGLVPADPLVGFLPVSDSTGTDTTNQGNGFVNFTINPASLTATGDTISASASIIFDINEAIATNREVHTLDALAPSSTISSPPSQGDTIILHFSAMDDPGGCGVRSYDLFMAKDSGNYSLHLTNQTDSVIEFIGTPGSTFHFFSLATDNVGNRESMKYVPDMSISFEAEINLVVKAFIEGFYIGNHTLIASIDPVNYPAVSDTLILQLANENAPYDIVFSDTSLLQTDGMVTFQLNSIPESRYYLVLRHRNSLETWNATPLMIRAGNNTYDFTDASSKAYGANMAEVEPGVWAIFTGDINQDGFIDASDFPYFDTDNMNGVFGQYVATDLNGDGFVDASDFPIYDSNNMNGVFTISP